MRKARAIVFYISCITSYSELLIQLKSTGQICDEKQTKCLPFNYRTFSVFNQAEVSASEGPPCYSIVTMVVE